MPSWHCYGCRREHAASPGDLVLTLAGHAGVVIGTGHNGHLSPVYEVLVAGRRRWCHESELNVYVTQEVRHDER